MARPAPEVNLSLRQRSLMEQIASSRTLPARLVERAKIVIGADDGESGFAIAAALNVDRQRTQRWRRRWVEAAPKVDAAEDADASDRELRQLIKEALNDRQRPGGPLTFAAETVAQLISLACEPPEDSGLPVTHWTPAELAKEAIRRGIVTAISPRHLDRLLKRGRAPSSQESLLDDVQGQA